MHSLKTNLSFSGGGTASITIGTGVITALVKNIQDNDQSISDEIETLNTGVENAKSQLGVQADSSVSFSDIRGLPPRTTSNVTTLGSYLNKHVNIVAGNSGGSWFHTLMQYSPGFFHMLNNGSIAQGNQSFPTNCTDVTQKMKYDSSDYYTYVDESICNDDWIGDDTAHSNSGRSRYAVGQTAWDYCSDLNPLIGQGSAPLPEAAQTMTIPTPCSAPDQGGVGMIWNQDGTTSTCAKVNVTEHTWRPDEYEYSCRCPPGYGWSDEGYGTAGVHHATGKCNKSCGTKINIDRGSRDAPTFKDYIVRHFAVRRGEGDDGMTTYQDQNSTLEYLLRTAVGHRRPGPCLGDGGCAINAETDNEMLKYFYWFVKTPWSQVVKEMVFEPADTMVGIDGESDTLGIIGREIGRPVIDGTSIVYAGVAMEDSFVSPTLMSHIFFPTCCNDDQLDGTPDNPTANAACVDYHLANPRTCGAGFPLTFNYNNVSDNDLSYEPVHGGVSPGGAPTNERLHCPMYPGPGNAMYQYEDYTDSVSPSMMGTPQLLPQLKNAVAPQVQAIDIAAIAGAAGAVAGSAPFLMNIAEEVATNLGPDVMGQVQSLLEGGIAGIEFTELTNILSGAQRGVGLHDYVNGDHPSWKRHVAEVAALGLVTAPILGPFAGVGYMGHKVTGGYTTSAAANAGSAFVGAVTDDTDMVAATQALKNAFLAISKLLVETAILVQFNVPSGHIQASQYDYVFPRDSPTTYPAPQTGVPSMRIKGAICTAENELNWTGCSPLSVQRVSNDSAMIDDVPQQRNGNIASQVTPDTDQGLIEHLSFRFGDGGNADNTGVVHGIATFQHANRYGVRTGTSAHDDADQEIRDQEMCYYGVHVGKAGQRAWAVGEGPCNNDRNNIYLNPDDTMLFGCHKPDGTNGGLNGCVSAELGPASAGCLDTEADPAFVECNGSTKCFNFVPHEEGGILPSVNMILPECLSRDPAELTYTHIWSGYKKLQKHKFEWYGGEYKESWPEEGTPTFTHGYSDMNNEQKQQTTWWNQTNFMNIYHVRTVTVDNLAFGVKAGMKVDLYFIHVETPAPTFPEPTIENVTGVNTYTVSAFDISQLMDAAFKERPGLLESAFFNTSNSRGDVSAYNNREERDRGMLDGADLWRASLTGPGTLTNPTILPADTGLAD